MLMLGIARVLNTTLVFGVVAESIENRTLTSIVDGEAVKRKERVEEVLDDNMCCYYIAAAAALLLPPPNPAPTGIRLRISMATRSSAGCRV